ncbi:hypothetical protein BDW42DRAFT_159238 [Aspergillus taichungensis]|uniref:Biogenesis of lysosome-related organelles complex 1 subunit CNL1 n=1 Tax=Aspergillus taichungensis TaxID=482145 RepID=A0A2J5I8D2_9EURO|nr:hypothetical protein BDW42DRAFT_159238 [Aspergillus taichungensis]
MSVSASIPDTSLGLTSSEIQILRQQQQLALQSGHVGNGGSRGRGTGRTSNSSSRATSAASAASSQGRLLLDPMSLRALSHQLDGLQEQIRSRIDFLEEQMQLSIQNTYDRAGNVIQNADAEIARTRAILASVDDLENELAKIGHIREIVKAYRARIEGLDQRLDQAAARRRR